MKWLDFLREPIKPVHFWRAIAISFMASIFAPTTSILFVGAVLTINAGPWAAEKAKSDKEENLILLLCLLSSILLVLTGINTLFEHTL